MELTPDLIGDILTTLSIISILIFFRHKEQLRIKTLENQYNNIITRMIIEQNNLTEKLTKQHNILMENIAIHQEIYKTDVINNLKQINNNVISISYDIKKISCDGIRFLK